MTVKEPDQFRKGIAYPEGESCFLLNALLPGVLNGLQSLILPGNLRLQCNQFRTGMVKEGLHKLLMVDAVQAAAYQSGMKHHRVEHASAVVCIPAAVEGSGVDEKALTGLQDGFVISGGHKTVTSGDPDSLPLFVPVPGNIADPEIILIAGNGEDGGAVFQQLPAVAANGGIAFSQCHNDLLYDGFVLEK
jgi:hypothetical protein